jgi:hypothetical protein
MSSWQRNWKMNVGMEGLQDAEFALEQHFSDGIIYYTMRIKACKDEDTWDDCFLVTRGRAHLNWAPQPVLPEWKKNDAGIETLYADGIKAFLLRVTAATRRLEGDVEPVTTDGVDPITEVTVTPLAVTMLIAKDAVKTSNNKFRDLLIVAIESEGIFPSGAVPAPDGTGHGDPH